MGTAATQAVVLLLGASVLPLAARHWSPTEFGQYAVTYRLLALIQPALTLSANVSVTRHLARLGRSDRRATSSVLLGSLRVLAFPLSGAVAILVLARRPLASLVFGAPTAWALIVALGCLLLASATYSVTVSALQGSFRMGLSNTLTLLYVGLVPIGAVLLMETPVSVLLATAAAWMVCCVGYVCALAGRPDPELVRDASMAIYRFGIRRVPGEFAVFGLFSIPALLVSRTGDARQAGFVSLAVSMVTLTGSLCTPISTVLLPHLSVEFAAPSALSWRRWRRSMVGTGAILIAGSVLLVLVLPVLLRIAFGSEYLAAARQLRLGCLAVPAYASYVVTRSLLDAYYERAVTMSYAVIAMAVFVATYAPLRIAAVPDPELLGFGAAVWTLAGLTVVRSSRLMRSLALADAR